jgi:septal ring factor EnvC (AmiA/AmiB activator)
MAKAAAEFSVVQLQHMLESKKAKLDSLIKQRSRLTKNLDSVEKQIAAIEGRGGGTRKRRRGRRARNPQPLSAYVRDILGRSRKGLSLAELAQKIRDSGYKTNSSDFKNVVYQCVYNSKEFYHDEKTQTYRVKSQKTG